jgi:hypothetical protein
MSSVPDEMTSQTESTATERPSLEKLVESVVRAIAIANRLKRNGTSSEAFAAANALADLVAIQRELETQIALRE